MEHQNNALALFQLALRITGAIVCYKQAKYLNRNSGSWAFLGFLFPIIAMIWVFCLKHKPAKKTNLPQSAPKAFTRYYTERGIIEVENTGERKVSINGEPAPDGIYQLNRYESIEVIDGKVKTNI